jgi:hypothetical protein
MVLLCACATPPRPSEDPAVAKEGTGSEEIRANSYNLLHQLLSEEKNLDKILIIKRESRELHTLVKGIAAASRDGANQLEAYAKASPSLVLREENQHLPSGELATRAAIAKTKRKLLLRPFEPRFEFYLLLTQSEALSYAYHLAAVAAAHEPNPERSRGLETLSEKMKSFHDRVVSRLASQPAIPTISGTP